MSTVALRGTLAFDETAKEWSWAGRWVFGDSVPVVSTEGSSASATEEITPSKSKSANNKKQKDTSQPFLYKWQEASEPSKIPVPSLNVKIIGAEEEEEEPEPATIVVPDPNPSTQLTSEKDETKPQDQVAVDAIGPSNTVKSEEKPPLSETEKPAGATEKATEESNASVTAFTEASTKTEETKPINPTSTPAVTVDTKESSKDDATSDAMQIDSTSDEKATTESTSKEAKLPATDTNADSKASTVMAGSDEKTRVEKTEKANLPEQEKSSDKVVGEKEVVEVNKGDDTKKEETKSTETTTDTAKTKATPMEIDVSKNDSSTPLKPKPEAPPKIAFDTLMPKFTNAAEKYSQAAKCPSSGLWKGHFENLIPGKKTGRNKAPQPPQIQKIQETFHLFLNATPSSKEEPDAQGEPSVNLFAFETTTTTHVPKISASSTPAAVTTADGPSPPVDKDSAEAKPVISLVQVRGCGTNEFGTFEIMGYLDLSTMVMEIQRQYVVTEIHAPSPRRRRSSLNSSTDEGPRPHSTRKRNPTWKRASYDPEEDRRRKRGRTHKNGSPMAIDDPDGIPLAMPFSTNPENLDSASGLLLGKFDSSAGGRGSKSRLVLPTQSKTGNNSIKRSTSAGGARAKRRSSATKTATNSASTKSGSTHIRLPAVGDPKKARWRAAHFLYYQRDDPEQRALQQQQQMESGSNGSPNDATTQSTSKAAAPKPKYVIYEGEMVDSKREGRGICLFSDNTLYEGQWKRNKEHGYGKLMSSDRKQIIYEGEWERGRMQGTGTYYYGSSDPLKLGSRYVGEFRENLRNGIGRYFLADGSVYDGQWRDGVMNGLGVFTWPDGSIFDGVWKDGKRNGQGLLRKADGFLYDGQWVNNTMEGRGSAIYPNGQKYEGSFSNGRREGRGTIVFTNGAVYEGRFRDDAVDGQGTMKMSRTMVVPREDNAVVKREGSQKEDFMIPISFQSDMTRILTKTGFM